MGMAILIVRNEDPVDLEGYLDGAGSMQFEHGSDQLPDFEQTVEANHSTNSSIRIKLLDFTGDGSTWTVTASHDNGNVQWTRSGTHAYCDFPDPLDTLAVSVSATNGANPPQTKTRTIFVKPKPQ
jgi:hypothetical protein